MRFFILLEMDELEVNYIIEKLTKIEYDNFINMFIDYFINDMGVKYDVDKLKENLVKGFILKSYEKNLIFIDVIKQDKPYGFIIYQIDKETSDWNFKTGYGFIREFYIERNCRGKGLGSLLLANAEKNLKNLGVKNVYLTSDEKEKVQAFYLKNNYKTRNIRCEINGNLIYEKSL